MSKMNEISLKLKNAFTKSLKKDDIPVAALISDENDFILAVASNKRHRKSWICGHAEINVINKLYKRTKSKNLKGLKLYSTMEPCKMCVGAIEQTGLNTVYYYVKNDKFGASDFSEKRIKFEKISDEFSVFFEIELVKYFKRLR